MSKSWKAPASVFFTALAVIMMRNLSPVLRRRAAAAVVVATAVVWAAAFFAGRALQGDDATRFASADSESTTPADENTPVPGATPDTSKPDWDLPYRTVDAALPRYEQSVNGITIGPNTSMDDGGAYCEPGEAVETDPSTAAASAVLVRPQYLPANTVLRQQQIIQCRGTVVASWYDYAVPPARRHQGAPGGW
jgi:hypothetical protein